ncbi:Dcp1-like decapping family protein [Trichuris suis]|nr:Dcp1-like decapping family protein [Trichuris suis]
MDINLATLRNYDGSIARVIHSAGHVALYKFDKRALGWRKAGVEGPLFICACEGGCGYKLFGLNRLNPSNFVTAVDLTFDCIEKGEFLLYKNSESIGAIWFSERSQRLKVIKCIKEVKKMLSWLDRTGQLPRVGPSAAEESSDIMRMLNNAYRKFLKQNSDDLEYVKTGGRVFTDEELNHIANLAFQRQSGKKETDLSIEEISDSRDSSTGKLTEAAGSDTDDNTFQEEADFNEVAVVAPSSRGSNRFSFNQSHLIKEDDYFCEKLYVRYKQIMNSKMGEAD